MDNNVKNLLIILGFIFFCVFPFLVGNVVWTLLEPMWFWEKLFALAISFVVVVVVFAIELFIAWGLAN